jgi:hypothetical protein
LSEAEHEFLGNSIISEGYVAESLKVDDIPSLCSFVVYDPFCIALPGENRFNVLLGANGGLLKQFTIPFQLTDDEL